jgi:hypothetical protein
MKPDDENGKLPTSERPFRVLIISGSGRPPALRRVRQGQEVQRQQAEHMATETNVFRDFDAWADAFAAFVAATGKVESGRYRVDAYKPGRPAAAAFYR